MKINKSSKREKNTENYLGSLSEEREGYFMKNEENGIEIKCEEKFVKHWERMGFKVIKKGPIILLED